MGKIVHDSQTTEEWRSGVLTRMRVSSLAGAQNLCIFEQWCAPGSGAPPHLHHVEEVLTVLAGQMEAELPGERVPLSANESIIVPPEVVHSFINTGNGELHVLAVLAAPSFEAVPSATGVAVRRWQAQGE